MPLYPPEPPVTKPSESKPVPSNIPSKLASTPPDSSTSKQPSPSESKSCEFGIPSPSVSKQTWLPDKSTFKTFAPSFVPEAGPLEKTEAVKPFLNSNKYKTPELLLPK